jgi:hypothetical protein
MHRSRSRSWFERFRRRLTGRVPYRCRVCHWRGWRIEPADSADGPREIHRALTDAEIELLEPEPSEGDRH